MFSWSQIGTILGVLGVVGGGLWKLASAWTKKAMAIGAQAEAEKGKELQVVELRKSHASFMERVEAINKEVAAVAKGLELLTARIDEREKFRREDTRGIPVRRDGE